MATTTNTPGNSDVTTVVPPTSQAPATEAKAAAEAESTTTATDLPTMDELKGIKYVGRSNIRTISIDEFASVGVEAPNDLRWDARNRWMVKTKEFNAAVRDYLATDPEFQLV